jgi:hypothetical protein
MKKFIALFLLVCFAGSECMAWGATGHRATGWIAEKHLSAKAKKKINEILGQQSLAMVSTWMDDIRSDSTYNYTADWHWVTVETGKTYEESPKNPNGDVIMILERLITELKSHKLDKKKEAEALKMLVHLVGDIHQPLHVGCCDDQGGNKVKVKWFRNESNLHRVWDSEMIDDTKLSFTELAQFLGTPDAVTIAKWQSTSVRDWAKESMTYRKEVYDIKDGNLGYRYSYLHLQSAKDRMLQAGVRLAGILNNIYGK